VKSFPVLVIVGLLALTLQGAIARSIPPPWCPDLAWLVVVALGLRWPRVLPGAIAAVILGYSMDLVSGSLMGQHALMRLLTFLAAALAARQLDLSGGLPVSIFVFLSTFVYGLAVVATLSFFVGVGGIDFRVVVDALCHGIANVLAAGPVLSLVERVLARLSDEEVARRAPLFIGGPGRFLGGPGRYMGSQSMGSSNSNGIGRGRMR
jgi:rod shape-determining protein MreD